MKKFVMTLLVGTTLISPVIADPCFTVQETATVIQGTIEQVNNLHTYTRKAGVGTRVCIASMNLKIKGSWLTSFGKYRFTPDVSEKFACEKAVEKAKVKALKKVVPEELRSILSHECDTRRDFGKWIMVDDYASLPWVK